MAKRIILICLLIALLFLWVQLFGFQKIERREAAQLSSILIVPAVPLAAFIPAQEESAPPRSVTSPENPKVVTYTSPELGLRFSYMSADSVFSRGRINEQGQTIIWESQKIIRIAKKSEITLKQAIEELVLQETYPECSVIVTTGRTALSQFETAELRPRTLSQEGDSLCPLEYYDIDEVRMFFYDTEYPDRLYFLVIGEEPGALAPDAVHGWYSTLEIIN